MPKGSLCENSDKKVSIVKKRFSDDDSIIEKELSKNRRKVEEKARSDLEAQVELVSCYLKRSRPRKNLNSVAKFKKRNLIKKKEKVETIPLRPKEIMNSKIQKNNNHRMLMRNRKKSIEKQRNSTGKGPFNENALNYTCKLWIRKGALEDYQKSANTDHADEVKVSEKE
ncbi:7571_t:CDS:2, partial [Gigaspora margarita]